MAKQTLDITNFIGGINRLKSHRDLEENEFLDLVNMTPENLTYLKNFYLKFKTILGPEDFQIIFGENFNITNTSVSTSEESISTIDSIFTKSFNGRNIFVFTHDYSLLIKG